MTPNSSNAMSKFGRLKDQALRPWTLDFAFDESIAAECSELDKALRRTSPFKKGGDYSYLKGNNDPNDVTKNISYKKKSIALKSKKSTNSTTNSNVGSDDENYDRVGDNDIGVPKGRYSMSKKIVIVKSKDSISHNTNNADPQSEPNIRKPLIINVMNTPIHDYSNLSQLQVRHRYIRLFLS